jgi:uncharacterized protein (DUF1330 family)
MSIYLVGAIDIENQQEYDRYVEAAGASLVGHVAESLAVDDDPTLFEGSLPARRIIMMRFDTEEEMYAWYRSDAYQAAMKHRQAGAKTHFLVALKGGYTL